MKTGDILGVHHVKIPVSDLARSRSWYERVLELDTFKEWPDDDGIVRGVSFCSKGDLALALREQPDAARGAIARRSLVLATAESGRRRWFP